MCTTCMQAPWRLQEMPDPLKLELKMVVLEPKPSISGTAINALNHRAISQSQERILHGTPCTSLGLSVLTSA